MKPIPGKRTRQNLFKGGSRSSLHAKVYIIDREYVVIGSFNLDPRSRRRNTELGLVIHNPRLAEKLVAMFEDIIAPSFSYQVELNSRKQGRLLWRTEKKGRAVHYERDPEPGLWRRFSVFLFYYLLPEGQL